MVRNIAIAGFTAAMALGLAAQAQEMVPELEGGPGSHPPQQQTLSTRQTKAAADKLKAQQAKLAQQAADLKAQQAKLDARAAELAAEEKRLAQLRADQEADHAAKLAEITRQKKAVEQQTAALHTGAKSRPVVTAQIEPPTRQPSALQTKPQTQAAGASISLRSANRSESRIPDANAGEAVDITKPTPIAPPNEKPEAAERLGLDERNAAPGQPDTLEQTPDRVPDRTTDGASGRPAFADQEIPDSRRSAPADAPTRALTAHLDLDAARRSCARAGEDAALARRYYSARYDDAVRVYQDGGWKLSGRMRLEDRRGYLLIDTICDVDADGEAQHFAFLRR